MAQPTKYTKQTEFVEKTDVRQSLDDEFIRVQNSLSEVIDNIGFIQRDDTALANDSVHPYSLSANTLRLLATSINPIGEWSESSDYFRMDCIFSGNKTYVCAISHTSTASIDTDVANGFWILVFDSEISNELIASIVTDIATNASNIAANALSIITNAADIATNGDDKIVGEIKSIAFDGEPAGWLKCSGQAVLRTSYPDLFATISTTYGVGDGVTTFNLPDFRGEFLRGFDDGRGVDSGRTIGSTQIDQMEQHNHLVTVEDDTHTHTVQGNTLLAGSDTGYFGVPDWAQEIDIMNFPESIQSNIHNHIATSENEGGTENSNENRPRNVAVNYIIRY